MGHFKSEIGLEVSFSNYTAEPQTSNAQLCTGALSVHQQSASLSMYLWFEFGIWGFQRHLKVSTYLISEHLDVKKRHPSIMKSWSPCPFRLVGLPVGHLKQSWALPVFFNFFTNKKWFFAFFIKLIWLGVGFLNRSRSRSRLLTL